MISRTRGPLVLDDGGRRLQVFSKYHPDLVDDIKDKIPWDERSWDSDNRCWRIDDKHTDLILDMLVEYFGKYKYVTTWEDQVYEHYYPERD